MKNHYYSLNEVLEFYKKFNLPLGGRMSGFKTIFNNLWNV